MSENLEISLINEVTGDQITELVSDSFEFALDEFLNDGPLKDLPFFGTLLKLYKGVISVNDTLLLKKVYTFLFQLKDVSSEKRKKFINKITEDGKYKQKVGEKLLFIINKMDDINKAVVLGNLCKASTEEKISFDSVIRLSSIVDKAYLPDIINYEKSLKKTVPFRLTFYDKNHLYNIGFLEIKLEEVERFENYYSTAKNYSDNKKPVFKYEINDYGAGIIVYGLNKTELEKHYKQRLNMLK